MNKISFTSIFTIIGASNGLISLGLICYSYVYAYAPLDEPIKACVVNRNVKLTNEIRSRFARCLGWTSYLNTTRCEGFYQPLVITPLQSENEIRIQADKAFFYQDKPSTLAGHVEIQDSSRIVNAETARIFRDHYTRQIKRIEFNGNVHYLETDKLLIARKATINPQDKSGYTEDVLYRINFDRKKALIPAWGRAGSMQRFANSNYALTQATYTTCAPHDKAWDLSAKSIVIDNKKELGIARNVTLKIRNWPIIYSPYLSFPTTKKRKSGFLMPVLGYTNVGGFDFGVPYYFNLAPNYDLTLIPHLYTERGVLLGAEFRYLSQKSYAVVSGSFLPQDAAYQHFLKKLQIDYPKIKERSTNRWSLGVIDATQMTRNLQFHLNVQQVSDDYYFQDFSTNLALITQRQLLRQADLIYSTKHWIFKGMLQSYQTLHPVNETPIADQYERLPQILAHGYYYDLPWQTDLNVIGQYDQFNWSGKWWNGAQTGLPHGPRLHFNPIFSMPQRQTWGYITPSLELVENYYQVDASWGPKHTDYNRFIPRYAVRSGLFFERHFNFMSDAFTQTLEPSLFYLNVPYQNQNSIPIYDTANMIFNVDQLFRTNRFSGFDRIGDANQLAYAVTSRWLSEKSGVERGNISIGQIKYFASRRVQLCRTLSYDCNTSPYELGQISPVASTSPIATRAVYYFNPTWRVSADYIWDTYTHTTNNSDFNLHYQPAVNAIMNIGYTYLVNGDVTAVKNNVRVNNSLHQGIIGLAIPFNEKWSGIGVYSHNISKNYTMMSLLGMQYDSCCWALRVIGGRTFKNLTANYQPHYNNNFYVQFLLKGLGSIANSDPKSMLNTYLPGYDDSFHN